MTHLKAIILVTGLGFALSGCASSKPDANRAAAEAAAKRPAVSEENRLLIAHEFFLRARQQEMKGNQSVALSFYQISFEYDSTSRDLCFIVTDRLKKAGRMDTSLAFAERCLQVPGTPEPEEYKMVGEIHLRQGNMQKALEYYEKALELDENDSDLLYTMATLYESSKERDKQIKILQRLVQRSGYPMRLVEKLAEVYGDQGQLDKVSELYADAWERTADPGFGERLATFFLGQELFRSSMETWQQLVREHPDVLQYKVQKAKNFVILDQADSAKATYLSLMTENPEEDHFAFQYGMLLYDEGKYAEAKDIFIELLEKKPENALYHFYLGSVGIKMDDKELAEMELNKSIALNGAVPQYWGTLARFYLSEGRDEEAFETAKKMTKRYKDNWYSWYLRGEMHSRAAYRAERGEGGGEKSDPVLEAQKLRENAVEYYRKAIGLEPKRSDVLFELAVTLEKLGRTEESIKTLKDVVRLDSANSVANNYLGYMLVEQNKELDFAGRLIDRALAIEPDNGAYLDSKGWLLFRKRDYQGARKYIERAIEKLPTDTTILEHYALILEKLGNTKMAAQQWREILKIDPENDKARKKTN